MILGVDIAKDKLDLYCSETGQHFQIKNTLPSIKQCFKVKLKKHPIKQVVFESTGGYEKILVISLLDLGIPYHRAHPKRVYHFGQAHGCFAKTDYIDARLLARYGEAQAVSSTANESRLSLELKELASRKIQVKNSIADEKRRLSGIYLCKQVVRFINKHIAFLEKQLEQLNLLIQNIIQADAELTQKQKLLCSISGVGKEISMLMVTNLPELGQLSREAISTLVGVAPRTQDSGQHSGWAVSQGRFEVRKALYMAALVASRHNPRMKAIYNKLISKGKKCKVALVAIMRKMIIMMNAMIKRKQMWSSTNLT